MYIQITTRCNMTCAHCGFSCKATGQDMSRETFVAACELAYDMGDTITIGGGEPTIHALFWDFIGISLKYADDIPPYVITNGSMTQDAIRLAKLGESNLLQTRVSFDQYHDDIDPSVLRAFGNPKYRKYTDDSRFTALIRQGRAKKLSKKITRPGCLCESLFITPDGYIYGCAHKEKTYGTVFNPSGIPEDCEERETCTLEWEYYNKGASVVLDASLKCTNYDV